MIDVVHNHSLDVLIQALKHATLHIKSKFLYLLIGLLLRDQIFILHLFILGVAVPKEQKFDVLLYIFILEYHILFLQLLIIYA